MSKRLILFGAVAIAAARLALAQDLQAFGGEAERMSTRILYYVDSDPPRSPGQLCIDYGQPEWSPHYEDHFDTLTKGKRWRLGKDFWTSLDTNLPITIGETKVAPGSYYLVVERTNDDRWSLVLLDPVEVRKNKLDAFQVEISKGGVSAPLRYEKMTDSVAKLTIKLVRGAEPKAATLEIQWGKHKLSAPITVQVAA
jgi:hypothetical protein